jgi:hypothetical protein
MSCKLLRVLRPKSGIYVTNQSTLATDDQVKAWTAACARQIAEHVAPAYNRAPVKVAFLTDATHAPAGAWIMSVLDDSDQADAFGYHSEDAAGRVYARVFMGPCLEYGEAGSVTLSHEIAETFCDPDVNQWRTTGQGFDIPYEACDPVQGGSYNIDGTGVSDFVYPAYYNRAAPASARLNHLDTLDKPFTLAPGGYYVRRFRDGTEDQVFGERADRGYIAAKKHELGRTARRLT